MSLIVMDYDNYKMRIKWLFAIVLLIAGMNVESAEMRLQESFGDREDVVASRLIGQISNADSAAIYDSLNREEKATFLATYCAYVAY